MPTSTNTSTQATTNRLSGVQHIVHLPRTLKIAGNVLKDARVSVVPKIMFVSGIIALLAALLTPEALAEFVNVFPVIGQLLGVLEIPVDGAIDWLAIGFAALNLMRLFPQDVVNEHYNNAVKGAKPSGPIIDADPHH
ncbi:MAG TPA: hypothetical protein VFQ25_00035 [Ktedonobacterales bacterium]|nr:hypothetical protein [Ktedonobacterales bacterium]